MAAPRAPIPGSSKNQNPDQAPLSIGRYTRLDSVGRGSFAVVYRGIHTKHKTFVAIKSVDTSRLNKKLKENLTTEVDILKGLHHPHIVALFDCQETANDIHLVMEYCDMGDLSQFIRARGTLGDRQSTRDMVVKYPNPNVGGLNEVIIRHFLKQLASALHFLRSKNLVHRDVKPQNLLLSPSPVSYAKGTAKVEPYKGAEDSFTPLAGVESLPMLKIADFGFARSLPSTSLAETLCGSPLYMAPEILRYEKYDATADLWSVGTVLYEMVVAKPPFRAANHVDLLRRIEQGGDKIRFPEGGEVSDSMKALIRKLLKRNPIERMNFKDFFNSDIIQKDIPGLVGEDREPENSILSSDPETKRTSHARRDSRSLEEKSKNGPSSSSPRDRGSPYETQRPESSRQPTQRPGHARHASSSDKRMSSDKDLQRAAVAARRPSIVTQTTAPARQEQQDRNVTAVAAERQRSRNTSSPSSSGLRERGHGRTSSRDERERAAQDVAFERDYVVVEKRAVEVNAFADELAASPRINSGNQNQVTTPRNAGTVTRRATTQGTPTSTTGAQAPSSSKAMQVATRPRADSSHQRQGSYERRYGPSPTSTASAISKALNLASGRLFGVGFSPPLALTRGGRSPPLTYNPYPAYPAGQGSLVMVGDGSKTHAPLDEDTKTVQMIEECATRSDVVYGFAEVKYKQLVPLTPSTQPENAIKPAVPSPHQDQESTDEGGDGLTADVIVTLSEEALVLYVKALSLLAKSMDIAGAWWARKNRGDVSGDASSSTTSPAVGNRVNNVVQWVRNRFNEVLEKAEFVRLKLIESQKQLPTDHPSHPSNNAEFGLAGAAMGTSVDNVVITSGITAEKLMYDRALEMSRTAAINELTGEDLPGCELAYMTSISMLEAVLENEDFPPRSEKKSSGKPDDDTDNVNTEEVDVEDKQVLGKLITSIRGRLSALRKKMSLLAKRTSAPPIVSGKGQASNLRPVSSDSPQTGTGASSK